MNHLTQHKIRTPGLLQHFDYFSHAFIGAKHGVEARQALNDLPAERERRYHPSGIVAGPMRIPYDGPAVILFHFSGNRIRGFEESLGRFDPAWRRAQSRPTKRT